MARRAAAKYNIPVISLNPVIDLKKTFNDLGVKVPNIPETNELLSELVFVNKDDELINPNDTIKKYNDRCIIFKKGGHRFTNISETIPYIMNFIRFNVK